MPSPSCTGHRASTSSTRPPGSTAPRRIVALRSGSSRCSMRCRRSAKPTGSTPPAPCISVLPFTAGNRRSCMEPSPPAAGDAAAPATGEAGYGTLEALRAAADRLRAEVAKVIVGQEDALDLMLVALFSDGHIL